MNSPQLPVAGKRKSKVKQLLAVFLIVGILIGIGAIVIALISDVGPESPTQTPTGAFLEPTEISKDVYAIRFGTMDRDIEFDECRIRIIPPAGNGSVDLTSFNLTDSTFVQEATTSAPGIAISEYNVDGKISAGDLVTITTRSSGYAAVDNGNWTIQLIFIKTGGQICSSAFVVSGNP
jgi:hypothetical protein